MNKIIAFQISFLIVFVPSYLFFSRPKEPVVLAEKTQATATPTSTPSPVPSPTDTPTPEPTIKATMTPTPVPAPKYSPQQVYEFMERFARQYGVSPDNMRYIARCESGTRPEAVNGEYAGLFQFDVRTWQDYRQRMGENPDPHLRLDAEEAVQTASYIYSIGDGKIWPNCQP